MGLFDGHFDPQQFGEGGGLLARLLAVQPQMGQGQAGTGFNPSPPSSQYAQALIPICPTGPVGWPADMGMSMGQILGGAAALLGGTVTLNNNASRPPAGSRPIDQTDWSGDHTKIKDAVCADPHDDVRISPTGEVWAQKPDGSWENHGPADTFTGSGKPSGRRGKDRDR